MLNLAFETYCLFLHPLCLWHCFSFTFYFKIRTWWNWHKTHWWHSKALSKFPTVHLECHHFEMLTLSGLAHASALYLLPFSPNTIAPSSSSVHLATLLLPTFHQPMTKPSGRFLLTRTNQNETCQTALNRDALLTENMN